MLTQPTTKPKRIFWKQADWLSVLRELLKINPNAATDLTSITTKQLRQAMHNSKDITPDKLRPSLTARWEQDKIAKYMPMLEPEALAHVPKEQKKEKSESVRRVAKPAALSVSPTPQPSTAKEAPTSLKDLFLSKEEMEQKKQQPVPSIETSAPVIEPASAYHAAFQPLMHLMVHELGRAAVPSVQAAVQTAIASTVQQLQKDFLNVTSALTEQAIALHDLQHLVLEIKEQRKTLRLHPPAYSDCGSDATQVVEKSVASSVPPAAPSSAPTPAPKLEPIQKEAPEQTTLNLAPAPAPVTKPVTTAPPPAPTPARVEKSVVEDSPEEEPEQAKTTAAEKVVLKDFAQLGKALRSDEDQQDKNRVALVGALRNEWQALQSSLPFLTFVSLNARAPDITRKVKDFARVIGMSSFIPAKVNKQLSKQCGDAYISISGEFPAVRRTLIKMFAEGELKVY